MSVHIRKGWHRAAAWLLALVMAATLFPLTAFSDGETADVSAAEPSEPPLVNEIRTDGDPDTEDPDEPGAETEEPCAETEEPCTETEEPGAETEEPGAETDEPGAETEEPGAETDEPGAGTDEPDPDTPEKFVVSYYNGETLLSQETVESGALPAEIPAAVADTGERIVAWKDESGAVKAPAEIPVTADVSYYAWLMPALEAKEHIRYINGQGEGKFAPGDSLTRAQAAQLLYNLLTGAQAGPFETAFPDVSSGAWYYNAVQLLASYGVINGYTDGSFQPNGYVTRAEFVTILVRVTGVTGSGSKFTDIGSHWAKEYIEAACAQEWLLGYEQSDGTFIFDPQRKISRAEAVTIINRVIRRSADDEALVGLGSVMVYIDVSPTAWYYREVMEASIPHKYSRNDSVETWTDYSLEGSGLEPGKYLTDGKWFLIDGSGMIVSMEAGINKVDGKFYYAASAGSYFTGDLSSKEGYCVFADGTESALTNGFNRINNTVLFYWDLSTASALKLKEGINTIDGTAYWADKEGYVIRNDFGRGVVTLGGRKYLSNGFCDIVTTGPGYKSATSKPVTMDLRNQTCEFDNNMYYIKSDYSLACDEWMGYLYFGTDCAYTTGDSTLDGYVWEVVKSFINNNALTKEQKLLKAYYYIRGGEGTSYASSPFRYRQLGEGFARGRYKEQCQYDWIVASANRMFSQKAGMCYEWAAVYLYLARRLGFQAYVIVGSVFQETTRHCWNMIEWDGRWHISDVEIEWGYMAGWYSDQAVYRDLFAQTVSSESFRTYKNPECALTYWVWEE